MSFVIMAPLVVLAITGCALAIFLALEVGAAMLPAARQAGVLHQSHGPITVVIPAHNEAGGLKATLDNILSQLRAGDCVLVVADNCDDDTAQIARAAGAKVIERNDSARRGKGYALQFALDHLRAAPPAIVVFADADCQFAEGALHQLCVIAAFENRPAQALYLMKAPEGSGTRLQVAEFAWAFMNKVRMCGLQRLFGVTRFTGAGFAAPWAILEQAQLASGEIVEDLAFTLQLVKRGAPPMLVPGAVITSMFPLDDAALTRQSARWSIGSLRFAAREAPGSFVEGVSKGRVAQIGASLDFMTPPLTVFAGALLALTGASLMAWLAFGEPIAFQFSLFALALVIAAIAAAWVRVGREAMPLSALPGVVSFLVSKAAVFGAKGRESAKRWTPTRNAAKDTDD